MLPIKNRNKIIEEFNNKLVNVKAWSSTFSLIGLEGIEGSIALNYKAYNYLYNHKDNLKNPVRVKLAKLNNYSKYDPNHNGLVLEEIEMVNRNFIKKLKELLCKKFCGN